MNTASNNTIAACTEGLTELIDCYKSSNWLKGTYCKGGMFAESTCQCPAFARKFDAALASPDGMLAALEVMMGN